MQIKVQLNVSHIKALLWPISRALGYNASDPGSFPVRVIC